MLPQRLEDCVVNLDVLGRREVNLYVVVQACAPADANFGSRRSDFLRSGAVRFDGGRCRNLLGRQISERQKAEKSFGHQTSDVVAGIVETLELSLNRRLVRGGWMFLD